MINNVKRNIYGFRFLIMIIIFLCSTSCSKLQKVTKPSDVLKKIKYFEENENYESIKQYLYNIKYISNNVELNSIDLLIMGIKTRKESGNFAYSNKGIEYHIKYVDKYSLAGDDEYIKEILIDSRIGEYDKYLSNLVKTDKNKIIIYKIEFTILGFVEINNELKLFFSKDLSDVDISDFSHEIVTKKIKK